MKNWKPADADGTKEACGGSGPQLQSVICDGPLRHAFPDSNAGLCPDPGHGFAVEGRRLLRNLPSEERTRGVAVMPGFGYLKDLGHCCEARGSRN